MQISAVASVVAAQLMQELESFGDVAHSVEVEPVPAVAPCDDPVQGGVAVAAEHNRNAPVSNGFRIDPDRIEMNEFAVERRDIVTPQRPHRGDVFRGARRAPLEWNAECPEFLA